MHVWPAAPAAKGQRNSGDGSFPGGQPHKSAPTTTSPPLIGGENAKMFVRLLRSLKAAYLRRSRASPEVTSEGDAPTPAREASPEDSRTNRHHLRRARRSPEERTPERKHVWPAAPAAEGSMPPAKPCVPGGNLGK
jgi:hypothetical protein